MTLSNTSLTNPPDIENVNVTDFDAVCGNLGGGGKKGHGLSCFITSLTAAIRSASVGQLRVSDSLSCPASR